jgi:hypothetical protein
MRFEQRLGVPGGLLAWQLHRTGDHHAHQRKRSLPGRAGFPEKAHDAEAGPTVDTDRPIRLQHRRDTCREHRTQAIHLGLLESGGSTDDDHGRAWRVQPQHIQRGVQPASVADVTAGAERASANCTRNSDITGLAREIRRSVRRPHRVRLPAPPA